MIASEEVTGSLNPLHWHEKHVFTLRKTGQYGFLNWNKETGTMALPKENGWIFENSYSQLPQILFSPAIPEKAVDPKLLLFNLELAASLGLCLDGMSEVEIANILSGSVLPEGACPLAMAYAGHQFGYFKILGDGRAILIGEKISKSGKFFDLHLKGSGQTPYSRRGDGKAALGPMLREYIISEAMFGLGVSTTRSLAVVATGESIEREVALPGAVLTRVASSHIRVGTFQFAANQGVEVLKALADYTIKRLYPEIQSAEQPYLELLLAVIERQAKLIAQWLGVGFIHGVMNTDNMAISGETIDYGPCAFMDYYKPDKVYSSIDRQGRYAYQNQPAIAHWNLERFAESLMPLLNPTPSKALEIAEEAMTIFPEQFQSSWLDILSKKLGLKADSPNRNSLIKDFMRLFEQYQPDFTQTFRALCYEELPSNSFFDSLEFRAWHVAYRKEQIASNLPIQLIFQEMKKQNPKYIPRNHQVNKALGIAESTGDLTLIHKLIKVVSAPFLDWEDEEELNKPPLPHEEVRQTFCGT